jgi:site-specific recombinase XerD
MEKKRITILPHQFKNNDYFLLKFNYDESLVSIARSLGCRWVVEEQGWAIYRSPENLGSVVRAFSEISIVDTSKIGITSFEETAEGRYDQVPEAYSNVLIRRGYTKEVINVYRSLFREFINHFSGRNPQDLGRDEVTAYLESQVKAKKIAGKTLEQLIDAINLFYVDILKRKKIEYPPAEAEKRKKIRQRISGKDLKQMLKVTKNIKHKAMISLLNTSDLKRSELIDLKKKDVNLNNRQINVKKSKQEQDKKVMIEPETNLLLRHYLEVYKPESWLFEGAKGKKYANSSFLSVLRRASFKADLDAKIPRSKRDPESETNWGS